MLPGGDTAHADGGLLSNSSEEDQRAMIAYLRALPAVAGRVPSPEPPRPDDPDADAFFFGDRARR